MARNDDSQRSGNAPSRVYKASDVHKRRVDRKGRTKGEAKAPEPVDIPAPSAEPPKPAEPAKSAVVITPEFGRRTQAQKEADDRWFASLAEQPTERISQIGERQPEAVEPPPEAPIEPAPAAVPDAPADAEGRMQAQPVEQTVQQAADQPESQPEDQPAEQPDGQVPEPQGDQVEGRPARPPREPAPKPPMSLKRRIAIVIGAVLFVALIAAGLFYTWNRWYRFDDHADLQGQWYVVGTTVPVEIDATSIHLTNDVVYQYELNTQDKTIRYTFGPMNGQGRYWFSDDRQYLVITDGDQFTSTGTAVDDLLRQFRELIDTAQGHETALPAGEGIIAFSREPDAKALEKERADAEAKKKAEEEARKAEERRAAEEAAAQAAEYEEGNYEEEPAGEEAPAEEPPAEERPAEENNGNE